MIKKSKFYIINTKITKINTKIYSLVISSDSMDCFPFEAWGVVPSVSVTLVVDSVMTVVDVSSIMGTFVVGLGVVGWRPGLHVCSEGQSHTLIKSLNSRGSGQIFKTASPWLHCQKVEQLSRLGYRHWLISQSSSGQVNPLVSNRPILRENWAI